MAEELEDLLQEEYAINQVQEFADDDDDYPLKEVHFAVPQKRVRGHADESGAEMSLWCGSGDMCGSFKIRRPCSRIKTKMYANLTAAERDYMLRQFIPVLLEHEDISKDEFMSRLRKFAAIK